MCAVFSSSLYNRLTKIKSFCNLSPERTHTKYVKQNCFKMLNFQSVVLLLFLVPRSTRIRPHETNTRFTSLSHTNVFSCTCEFLLVSFN